MNKKKYVIILILVFILGGITNHLFVNKNKENIVIYRKDNKGTFKNALSMMLETNLDSGEYERSTSNKWPTEGYIFNKQLSKCENGGELDWDPVNNQVLMIGASSDKCYVYFDKYTSVIINNLSLTSTPTSITATVTATAGSASISKYLFSINNGAYIESDSNIHTFVGLNSSEEYSISVKAIDSNGKTSSVTTKIIETSAYVLPSIIDLSSSVTSSTITVTATVTQGTGEISKYYYSKDGGSSYTESTSNSFTFSNLSFGTTYSIKVYVKDSNDKTSAVYSKSIKTANQTLAAYIKSLYTSQGSNGIYYHTSSLANSAGDNSYRYSGNTTYINNFVCFGSDASTCPNDNLYRIIGVFGDQVKLMKYDYATSNLLGTDGDYSGVGTLGNAYTGQLSNRYVYYWNKSTSKNTWSESNLNKINLNKNFINNIGSKWSSMIVDSTWKVGGNRSNYIYNPTASNIYNYEILNPITTNTTDNKTNYTAKVGLIYVSDYGFASSTTNWGTTMNNYTITTSNNWMYIGLNDWTITRLSDENYMVAVVGGSVSGQNVASGMSTPFGNNVRPCFYLNADVNRSGGTGSYSDPYRIAL